MAPPLSIAIFVGTFPAVSETFILRQITALLDLGHDVHIFSDTRAPAETPVHEEVLRYRLPERTTFMDAPPEMIPWEMPVRPVLGRTWPPGEMRPKWNIARIAGALPVAVRAFLRNPSLAAQTLKRSQFGFQAQSLSALWRLSRLSGIRRRYDVLHAHFGPVANSYRFARRLWNAPLIASFHGYDLSTVPRTQGPDVYASLFRAADRFIANSEYTRAQLLRLGCTPQKIHVLPVGLDPNAFPFRERTLGPGPLRILSVGRLVEIKGHEYLIRAMARVREKLPDARCDIVGDGPLRTALTELTRSLGLEGCVTFHGALDGTGIRKQMHEAHLFVLPSVNVHGDQEGQGLALQEAQACGLPVMATRHGAFPEGIVENETGFLVPERDPEALASRILSLAATPQTWAAIGTRGREFVAARYDIRQLTARLVDLYRECLRPRPKPA